MDKIKIIKMNFTYFFLHLFLIWLLKHMQLSLCFIIIEAQEKNK